MMFNSRFYYSCIYVLCATLVISFFPQISNGQSKRGNIGIFGNGAGLDFNYDPPKIISITTSPENSYQCLEGSASISDTDGKLLFYTDGTHVWNRNNAIMPNGHFLYGFIDNCLTSTTQCVIIPIPKDPFQYYIISAGCQGGDLKYSLVDMRLKKGLGDVVFKGSVIYGHTTEKMCVIQHHSKQSLWLVTHEMGSNKFRANLVDENGLHTDFVESAAGLVHVDNFNSNDGGGTETNAIGYMKASHDGRLIACAVSNMGTLEYFQFNDQTGEVVNGIQLPTDSVNPYGLEFSPDNSKLYVSGQYPIGGHTEIFQFDLNAGNTANVINSKTLISYGVSNALQLGGDNKIYVNGRRNIYLVTDTLDIIREPNKKGLSCNFQKDAVYLNGKFAFDGLPEFIYNPVDPEIVYNNYCTGKDIKLELIKIKQFASVKWNFGDPDSGAQNQSTDNSPHHTFEKAGKYNIHIDVGFDGGAVFSYTQPLTIYSNPSVDLGKDTLLCKGQSIILSPKQDALITDFTWDDQTADESKTVTLPGKYWLEVSTGYCTASDTIEIGILAPPSVTVRDTVLCYNQELHLSLSTDFQYLWNDGAIENEKTISKAGRYQVISQNRCGTHQSRFTLSYTPKLSLNLKADTLLCSEEKLTLDVSSSGASYRWQDGKTSSEYKITEQGIYWVDVYNRCESLKDTISVTYIRDAPFFIPNVITPNGDDVNDYLEIDKDLKTASLEVFNRWDEIVYSSEQYKNDWQGGDLETGAYFYFIKDKCSAQQFKGSLHILR